MSARSLSTTVRLDPSRLLGPDDRNHWTALLREVAGLAGADLKVGPVPEPSPDQSFAYIAGSSVLSDNLLRALKTIVVRPHSAPHHLPSQVLRALGGGSLLPGTVRPTQKRVTLVSSVHHADSFLDGFLSNCEELEGYHGFEHFLIRAGSTGREHQRLLEHVQRWPETAVYINLPDDPGVYGVWNLAAQLSTAPYLSSANVDDRRAPGHTRRLADWLDNDRAVAAVSAELHVTEAPNVPWQQAAEHPLLFGDKETRTYGLDELTRTRRGRVGARNLPHCMPVWRRSLHALYGYFDERRFGPSADWAFWLRVGASGGRFGFLAEPLGLYHKHLDSYWHRKTESDGGRDGSIARRYAGRTNGRNQPEFDDGPIALQFAELRRLLDRGAYLEFFGRYLSLAGRVSATAPAADSAALQLIDAFARRYFGIPSVRSLESETPQLPDLPPTGETDLKRWSVELARCCTAADGDKTHGSRRRLILQGALSELHTVTGQPAPLIALPLLQRRAGDADAESSILRDAATTAPRRFWSSVQDVYRFDVSLAELCERTASPVVSRPAARDGAESQPLNLWYYPAYSNPYQTLLYEQVSARGARVTPLKHAEALDTLVPASGRRNVFHLHWLNRLFPAEGSRKDIRRNADRFLSYVRGLKERGIRFYWTVHNRLSHDSPFPKMEADFRARLAGLADRVYVHHPMAVEGLDWLPDGIEPVLSEHGPYPRVLGRDVGHEAAREDLGFRPEDCLIAAVGRVRPYKVLYEYVPVIAHLMRCHGDLHLAVVGKMSCHKTQAALSELPDGQVHLRDGFVEQTELERWIVASDYVFLSYREVLTSGALFHAFSVGTPVIAPTLGTIPAYVVDGWNGFLYNDASELGIILDRIAQESRERRDQRAANALHTASQLSWRFP